MPERNDPNDAGFDCFISQFALWHKDRQQLRVISNPTHYVQPSARLLCKLGFAMEMPPGYYAQLVPRSGYALKLGLTIANTPGTIDSGYRNEVGAIVLNTSSEGVKLNVGDKICQLIIRQLPDVELVKSQELAVSSRGLKGFGSSGR